MTSAQPRGSALSVPNILTYSRIAAVPALFAAMTMLDGHSARWAAFAIFLVACLTDWLDGYLARAWSLQSPLGQMLDPIADKLLVGAALLSLVYDHTISGVSIWAALIVLTREILVSGLREFLAALSVKVLVTHLAKWKTAVQMAALAVLIAGPACGTYAAEATSLGLALLWVAAILTLWTGFDYFRAALRHATM
ncbi:MAG: CDP-diacylglycerol--glycerol-3-phosphate 3-phosphatidyltransferase [Hyphomicrobiaceae bacterium]